MIIMPKESGYTKVFEDGDKTIIQHVTDNTALAEQAQFIRNNTDRGFTDDRQYQLIGYIPMDVFVREGLHRRPTKDAARFLETSEEMRPFRVSERNTGRTGRIIVK